MKKYICAFVIGWVMLSLTNVLKAQDIKVEGYVKDSITLTPIAYAQVQDGAKGKKVSSDENGFFVIHLQAGDTIVYSSVGYATGKFVYTSAKENMDTLELWLKPFVKEGLPGVLVSTYTYENYQNDSATRRSEFISDAGVKKATFDRANSGAGLGISLDNIFGKKEKSRRSTYKNFEESERQHYVDFRFNSIVVHSYTGLKGDKLHRFMVDYRPTYEWLRDNPTLEDLKYYINAKLKEFFQRE